MKSFDISRLPDNWVVKKCDDPGWQTVIDVMNFIDNNCPATAVWIGNNTVYPYYGYSKIHKTNNHKSVPTGYKLLGVPEFLTLIKEASIPIDYLIF